MSDFGLLTVTCIIWGAGLIMFLLPPIPGVPGKACSLVDISFLLPLLTETRYDSVFDDWNCTAGSRQ